MLLPDAGVLDIRYLKRDLPKGLFRGVSLHDPVLLIRRILNEGLHQGFQYGRFLTNYPVIGIWPDEILGEILYSPWNVEYSIHNDDYRYGLNSLTNFVHNAGLSIGKLPEIVLSYDDPPVLKDGKDDRCLYLREKLLNFRKRLNYEKEEISFGWLMDSSCIWDYEKILGLYNPLEERIYIFQRGIEITAMGLYPYFGYDVSFDLRRVVLMHEISHWITHMVIKEGKNWPTLNFAKSTDEVLEGWAQLLTWLALNSPEGNDELRKIFKELNLRQSQPYKVFKKFTGYSPHKLADSLVYLRNLGRPAELSDWVNFCRNNCYIEKVES